MISNIIDGENAYRVIRGELITGMYFKMTNGHIRYIYNNKIEYTSSLSEWFESAEDAIRNEILSAEKTLKYRQETFDIAKKSLQEQNTYLIELKKLQIKVNY